MAAKPLDLLTLPATALGRASPPAVRDALEYFDPELVVVPGERDPTAHATVRDAAPAVPVLHPQLARGGRGVRHYRRGADGSLAAVGGETEADSEPAPGIDVLAVGNGGLLRGLGAELREGKRRTGEGAATYLVVPRLAVEWDATALEAELPGADSLAAVAAALPEPVTVFAGGQPADYYHEWELDADGEAVTVPVAGLGATERGEAAFAEYTCTPGGSAAAEAVSASNFGLQALDGVGPATADRLRERGCRSTGDVRDLAVRELLDVAGIGRSTAERMHAHAEVIASGEPLVTTNKTPVKSRDGRPPLCLDIETDGLSPTIVWQFGVYDPDTDEYRAFLETEDPTDPAPVLAEFITWFLANHAERTVLTWNGHGFDYRYIEQFLRQHAPEYAAAWADVWTYDLYKWAVRDGNALLPGRTNKLDHVARALGYESAETGLTGAQTAAAYQEFMRDPDAEPDWERHRAYCEDDCRALHFVYEEITNATRRDTTDSGAGGADGRQAGLTDF
jgi:hypothetical protein